MKVKEIRSLLEQAAPEAYAMGWDNSGLILGRTDKEVKKILITVDVDDNTVDQALLQGADLVLSHHPLVFQAVKRITDEELSEGGSESFCGRTLPMRRCIRIMMFAGWEHLWQKRSA